MKIGFIGLGIMGKPMSKNLIKAGYTLVVRDHNASNEAELVELGATVAKTPKELAAQVDVIITMLPNSPHVKEVCAGRERHHRRGEAGPGADRHELHRPAGQPRNAAMR